jgi:hypothetical protein
VCATATRRSIRSTSHARPLNAFPIAPYEFEDGVFIVAAEMPELVGSELLALNGHPVDEVNDTLAPLVARDNEWTIRARRPVFSVTAEVLRGLGKHLAVLISRVTFSAAMQLVVDLEQRTPAVFVGEPTGAPTSSATR